ncbi:hypothetical protein HOT99_gp167 [Caulobacter phage CcrBL10]|uniref:Uncharacterized protein n=1 Tax=Caulobacter phage CcrBL10 TaxID=2283269 RepID=A0A385E9U3_9CAUD|nr:hypothetical protein HOT99_gp167 [Caulobacter phage CcrBL10]AXQ68450.1 hypothetical protein CcrBL10_gp246 [Caulobacter phage CcrBL10]
MSVFTVILSQYDEQRFYIVEAGNNINALAHAKRVAESHDDNGSIWKLDMMFVGAPDLAMKAQGLKVIDLRATVHEPVPHAQRGGGC